jgi:hypothetical protein
MDNSKNIDLIRLNVVNDPVHPLYHLSDLFLIIFRDSASRKGSISNCFGSP